MTPSEHAEQLPLVHKLAALRQDGTKTGNALLAALDDAELEVMLRDFPKDLSEPLTLFALITAKPDESGLVRDEKLADWIQLCATWLCLEWLKRNGALTSYVFGETGINWQADPVRLTASFLDDLKRRHSALHHFAAHVFRRAAPEIGPGTPTLN